MNRSLHSYGKGLYLALDLIGAMVFPKGPPGGGQGMPRIADIAMYTYIRTQETTLNTNYVNNGHIKRFLYTVVITLSSRKISAYSSYQMSRM